MPVYKVLSEVKMNVHATHEQWDKIVNSDQSIPSVHKIELGEHTGTHVDSISHMDRAYSSQSIDTMPFSMFYTEGICLDFSFKKLSELISVEEMKIAL